MQTAHQAYPAGVRLVVLTLCLTLPLSSCIAKQLDRTLRAPDETQKLDHDSATLKAHMKSGELYLLTDWKVDERTRVVSGMGVRYGLDRGVLSQGRQTIAIDDVALFETNVEKTSPAIAGMVVVTLASVAVTAACIANPKACFGSCPTFYAPDADGGETLMAEGFSASVTPSLEARDVNALWTARASTSHFELRVTNEALETHVIRRADLLVAERPPGGRVIADQQGSLWQAVSITPVRRCEAAEGDCTAAVRSMDASERFSRTDGHDLATREEVALDFDVPAGDGQLALVIGARQTFLSTFLFYQALAFMGTTATERLAELERGDAELSERARALDRVLGNIEVQARGAGGDWATVGEIGETGPIATDVKLVRLPDGVDARSLRLRLTRGHWRLGWIALARVPGPATAHRVRPSAVRRVRGRFADAEALSRLRRPDRQLLTFPGDEYAIDYELPVPPARAELLLDAKGYYLEWMRTEWMKDESPVAAALLLYAPRQAMVILAPRFAAMEPNMERMFWESRYAPR